MPRSEGALTRHRQRSSDQLVLRDVGVVFVVVAVQAIQLAELTEELIPVPEAAP